MKRMFVKVSYLTLLLIVFSILSGGMAAGMNENAKNKNVEDILKQTQNRRIPLDLYKTYPKARLAGEIGDETAGINNPDWSADFPEFADNQRGVVAPGAAVGLTFGWTTYDMQHHGRCTRQVAWRNTHNIHLAWIKKNNSYPVIGSGVRITTYEAFNAETGSLRFSPPCCYGGDDLHASGERSGFCGIDVMSDGRALVYNHYDPDGLAPYNYYPVVWPDYEPLAGLWGYKQGVPYDYECEPWPREASSSWYDWCCFDFKWPYAAFQLYDNGSVEDTLIHIIARGGSGFASDLYPDGGCVKYWRRTGGPHPASPANGWSSMVVDTSGVIGHVVECAQEGVAAGYEGKVALVWIAPWPDMPGGAESATPDYYDLLVEQNANDIYGMVSMDGGVTWGDKFNITQNDFLDKGWVPLSDLSALIDSDGRLHVVYSARQFINTADGAPQEPADMDWPLFPMASRIFHWSDENPSPDYISIVKDASHDWTKHDSICMGGQWSMMAVTKPMISQCDNKLYVLFSQYQDIKNGIWDNCHLSNWYGRDYIGSANANLYFTVSDMTNGGLNWDPSRLLTDFTPRCDTAETGNPLVPVDPEALNVCHSHGWPSMTRMGMEITPEDHFEHAVIVSDPTWNQTESPDYYLDVFYVDDLWPGAVINGEGMWTVDPLKWFRLPCVDAESEPALALDPVGINLPEWGKPGVQVEYNAKMTNVGNMPLTVSNIRLEELNNFDPAIDGWLAINDNGFGGTISEIIPGNSFDIDVIINNAGIVDELHSPAILTGRVIIESDSPGGSDTLSVSFLVADTLQTPELKMLYTDQISLAVENDGAYGCGLIDNFGQMDFHSLVLDDVECDTCSSGVGSFTYKYLYDASPFILTNPAGNPRVSASIHEMDWLSRYNGVPDGLRPLEGMSEVVEGPVVDVLDAGVSCSADSTVGLKSVYIAPQTPDTNQFMVQILKFYNMTDNAVSNFFVGTVEDWDIPADTGVRNTSDFDLDRKLMYMTGWEVTNGDTYCSGNSSTQNNCAEADLRVGGSAFFCGFQYKPDGIDLSDKYEEGQGVFTTKTVNWLGGNLHGHLPADRLYDTLSGEWFFGYSPWYATDFGAAGAESLYQDLTMVSSFGQFSLGVEDTLTFVKFLVSEYDGGVAGIQETVDKARAFTLHYLCCDIWGLPGDANTDQKIDILDIVYLINFIYKDGDGVKWPSSMYDPDGSEGWPTDNCDNLMDMVPGGSIDILDIVYLINYIYKGGPEPQCPYPY